MHNKPVAAVAASLLAGLVLFATFPVTAAHGATTDAQRQATEPSTTFNRDVAPILFRHCVTCHNPGVNSAFSLLTYEDVRPRARLIAAVTQSRYMPPWKPEPGYGEFIGARRLGDEDIAMIQLWVKAGASRGDPADLPAPPHWTEGWRLGMPDLVIRMPEPYDFRAVGPDGFRNFVLSIPTNDVRYIKAIEFLPGTTAVHHANMRIDETSNSRRLDDDDPAPGYEGLTVPSAHYPDGQFFGWTPGQLPPMAPDLAWRLNPGSDMVVQLHLKPTGKVEHVQVAIGLYFASGPPRLTPAMLRLGKQDIEIAPGVKEYVVADSYVLPVDVDVYAVQPHAHYRAKEIKGFATLPDGTTKWLIYVRDWDFNWQDQYRYVNPIPLPKDTKLSMRYTYDNSAENRRNPQLPPQRVLWGQHSSDEMGDLWIQVVPRSTTGLEVLVREIRQKVLREDIAGCESVLRVTPDDVALHDDVALLYLSVGRVADAIRHFTESVRLAPGSAAAHFNLGTALTAAGRLDTAIAEYRQALQLKPDYAYAHNNLGSLLLTKGRLEDATAHYRRALDLNSTYAEAHSNLANVLLYQGHTDEAFDHARRAIEMNASYPEARYNMARILLAQGHARDAVVQYRTAMSFRPDWPPPLSELAWILATHPDDGVRDPSQAIKFAERVVALTNSQQPVLLDVLAAAYASGERFDLAIASAQAALALLPLDDPAGASAAIRLRLALYERRQPYVDTRAAGPAHVRR